MKNVLWHANVPKRVPKVIPNRVPRAAHEPLFLVRFPTWRPRWPKGLPKSPKWLPRAPRRAPGMPKRCPKGATSDPQECPNDFKWGTDDKNTCRIIQYDSSTCRKIHRRPITNCGTVAGRPKATGTSHKNIYLIIYKLLNSFVTVLYALNLSSSCFMCWPVYIYIYIYI